MDFNRNITTADFNEICRLCLRRENLVPLFKKERETIEMEIDPKLTVNSAAVLSEMINICFGLEVIC